MSRWLMFLVPGLLLALAASGSAAEPARGLDIYFVDTEGGAATLIVTPTRESILIDCGNPGNRDATRIHQAARQAGLEAIEHLIITHWHTDHYGGAAPLARLLPIRQFYDRGIPEKLVEDPGNFPTLIRAYRTASGGKSKTLKPGDEIKLKQAEGAAALSLRCLCGQGEVIADAPGAPLNPVAKKHKPQPDDPTDNARSLGFLLRLGEFRFLDLGDLTWNIEYKLVHPTDKIGPVDVYQVTHHGLGISNNPVLMETVRPRVAVFNNGPRKGCDPQVMANLRRVPGIQAIYQLHRNLTVGDAENTDLPFIANHAPKGSGEWIHLAVAPDGRSYTVTVGAKGKPRRYTTRGAE
jgi:beta-lactamase superfamily II metal-dependent hydrolase